MGQAGLLWREYELDDGGKEVRALLVTGLISVASF
jgi:hypothetical protein